MLRDPASPETIVWHLGLWHKATHQFHGTSLTFRHSFRLLGDFQSVPAIEECIERQPGELHQHTGKSFGISIFTINSSCQILRDGT